VKRFSVNSLRDFIGRLTDQRQEVIGAPRDDGRAPQ
jgi:hypothetical protein